MAENPTRSKLARKTKCLSSSVTGGEFRDAGCPTKLNETFDPLLNATDENSTVPMYGTEQEGENRARSVSG